MPHDRYFRTRLSIWANPVRFTYGGPHEIHVAHLQRREGLAQVHRGPTAGFHGGIHEIHPADPVGRTVVSQFSVATDVGGHQRPRARRKRQVTDGPFAETRQQLGGYYLIEAKNLDEAIAIAARIPSVSAGTVEVRPLV